MATAYSPGLKVSYRTIVRKTRRLPLKGNVVVEKGRKVEPDTVVARTEIPAIMQSIRAAEILGLEPAELPGALLVQVGDAVTRGQTLAERKSLFGLLKSDCKTPISGVVEMISEQTGNIGIRLPSTPVEVSAYIEGVIAEVIPDEGVIVETEAAHIQGIFGIGGERTGIVRSIVSSPTEAVTEDMITPDLAGQVVVGGSNISGSALKKASDVGVTGIVVGAILDSDLIAFLGYDIGVAITGQEDIDITLIVTEGFGAIPMADGAFRLLTSLDGRRASINGATQIRAGVIRPELIVPNNDAALSVEDAKNSQTLAVGSTIRVIRQPYFGMPGTVTALPSEPTVIPTGSTVRVVEVELVNGERVCVPRANVEIIEE